MMAARMIPALWFRLVIIIGFIIFTLWKAMWVLALIGVLLVAVTGWQLSTAYKTRDSQREDT